MVVYVFVCLFEFCGIIFGDCGCLFFRLRVERFVGEAVGIKFFRIFLNFWVLFYGVCG